VGVPAGAVVVWGGGGGYGGWVVVGRVGVGVGLRVGEVRGGGVGAVGGEEWGGGAGVGVVSVRGLF